MPTYEELLAMSRAQLEELIAIGASPKLNLLNRQKVLAHIAYCDDLVTYGEYLKGRGTNGTRIGLDTPPPPPTP